MIRFLIRIATFIVTYSLFFGVGLTFVDVFGDIHDTNFTFIRIVSFFGALVTASVIKITLGDKDEDKETEFNL